MRLKNAVVSGVRLGSSPTRQRWAWTILPLALLLSLCEGCGGGSGRGSSNSFGSGTVSASTTASEISTDTTFPDVTSNNTSTSSAFSGTKNGNPSPHHISKVDVHTLLYADATTRIYSHYMPWFGNSSHLNIGLNENDPAVVSKQVDDMVSRGLNGVVVDWYGPGNFNDTSTVNVMAAAEQHPGFEFAICEDKGAIGSVSDPTQKLIDDLKYASSKYENSPNYMRREGRPVVFFFGVESLAIDWNRARANTSGNPLFIFENNFGYSFGDGAFSWTGLNSDPNNPGLFKLDTFYSAGIPSAKLIVGSGYKGFDDSIAPWGQHRLNNQRCGQTWLESMAESSKYFSAAHQLDSLQIVTWNDYEEGSEVETGIDNCISVSASISGSALSWSIDGDEGTLDHFTVFSSTDGFHLHPVADLPTGSHTLDLNTVNLSSGKYQIFVKAVGKPMLFDHVSAPVSYSR